MRIATGEIDETLSSEKAKNAAAVVLGRVGGQARAQALSAEKKAEIATNAANARWGKKKRHAPRRRPK